MVADVTTALVCTWIGRRGATRTKHLATVFQLLGFKTRDRLSRGYMPDRAIVKLKFRGRGGKFHWVVLWDGQLYDPWPHHEDPCKNPKIGCYSSFLDLTERLA